MKQLYVKVLKDTFFCPKDELGLFYAEVYDETRTNRLCIVRELQIDLREFRLDFTDGSKVVVRSRTLRNWIPPDLLILPSCRFRHWYSRFMIGHGQAETPSKILLWPRSPFHSESKEAKKRFDYAVGHFTLVVNRQRFIMACRTNHSLECSRSLESVCGTFLLERSWQYGSNDSFRVTINRDEGHADTVASIAMGCLFLKGSDA